MALVFPLPLSAISFFFSTASVPSGHHWRFGVRSSSLSSDALALARLLCSALLSYLSYSQAGDVRTHSPTYHRAARKGVWSKGSWPRARCFVLFYLFYSVSFFFFDWNPVLSHRFLLRGLIPAHGMGWLLVPLDGYFLCFWTVGAFRGVCVRRWCVQDLYE